MKNKGLLITVGIIIAALVGFGAYSMLGQDKEKTNSTVDKEKTYTVGVLQFVSHPALDQIYEGVKEGLKEEGFEEGKNLKINFQNGQADQSKLTTMAQQLIQDKSEVLVGIATPAAQSLANATTKIPVVLGAVTDPVGAELVKSNEEPGGNVTGVSDQPPVDQIIDLAHNMLPEAKKVGMLYSSSEKNSQYQVEKATEKAKELGLEVVAKPVASTNEVAQTVQILAKDTDFIFIPNDNTIANAMETVATEAQKNKLPVFPSVDTMVEQGGLATIGVNQKELGVQTGKMAAAILKGESDPATTPVYTFKEGKTIINEKVAKELGVTISDDLKKDATIVE